MSNSAYVCVFRDFELLRYAQFSLSLCVNVKDRTTALISRWDEDSILLLLLVLPWTREPRSGVTDDVVTGTILSLLRTLRLKLLHTLILYIPSPGTGL